MEAISTAAIDKVLSIAPAQILQVGDYEYIDKGAAVKLFEPPIPQALRLSTLSGFAGLLDEGFENYPTTGVIVQVSAYDTVQLILAASDKWGRRQVYLETVALKPERKFAFNQYMAQEEFNIALRSMFEQDSAIDELISITGNLAAKAEVRQEDDGFTQTVTAKAGVHRVENITAKPRVTLRPFRTFSEVAQPSGEFILRVKSSDAGNQCALFEADAGAWKNQAMDSIASWLRNRIAGSKTEGVPEIPVVA